MDSIDVIVFAPSDDDAQAATLTLALREMGVAVLYLPFRIGGRCVLDRNHRFWRGVDLSQVKAVYLRSLRFDIFSVPPGYVSEAEWTIHRAQFMMEAQRQAFMSSFLTALSRQGSFVVNPPHIFTEHLSKMAMYLKLQTHGFSIPETIMTSDPNRAAEFIQQGVVVAKPAAGIGTTCEVTPNEEADLPYLTRAPILFQRKVIGDTVRVHVVGDRVVLALRIKSDTMDSRTNPKAFIVEQLPPRVENEIVRATHFLGAHFAAWDIILTENEKGYLLDFNPGPYVWWIGDEAAPAVLKELARMLATYVQTENQSAAYTAVQKCRLTFSKWYKIGEIIKPMIIRNRNIQKKELRNRW